MSPRPLEDAMPIDLARWSLVLLCIGVASALGGGLYEHLVLKPLWSKAPPSSFAVIQPGTGVPLQRFWVPVHAAITLLVILALVLSWKEPAVRRLLLVGLAAYVVMRAWSFAYFIPEMIAFQKIPLDASASPELSARVARWVFWTWFRQPLDVIFFVCCLLALGSSGAAQGHAGQS